MAERAARDRLAKLQAVTAALSEALTPDDVGRVVAQQIAAVLAADQAILVVPDRSGLRVASQHGFQRRFDTLPTDSDEPAVHAFRTGTSQWFEDRAALLAAHPSLRRDVASAAMVTAPLAVKGRVLGAVGFGFLAPRTFDAATRALVDELACSAALALERARLYALAERRGREMARLFELATATNRAAAPAELYDVTLAAICELLEVERAAILLRDGDGVMRFVAWRGLSEAYRTAVDGHSPWQPDERDPVAHYVADWRADATLAGYAGVFDAEGIRSLAFIPLVDGGLSIGKLMMYGAAARTFSAEDAGLATTIATTVTGAVLRARWIERERRLASHSALLARTSHELLRTGFDRIALLEAFAAELGRALDIDVSLTLLAEDGALRHVGQTPDPDHTGERLSLPLRAHGRVLGALEAWRTSRGPSFTADERALLEQLAERAALAVSNALLFEQVEEANRSRDEILAVVSHDLRGPLATIMMAAELVPQVSPEAAKRLDMIRRNGLQMSRLIADLLDFASLQSGRLAVVASWFAPEEVLVSAAEMAATIADERRVRVTVRPTPGLPSLHSDRERLIQALGNLVSNAVKVCPAGGHVELDARQDGDMLELSVRDTGPGIAEDERARIFERYWRGGKTTYRGHGLGLAITKGIVEALGGTIRVDSVVGQGSTFSFSVPL